MPKKSLRKKLGRVTVFSKVGLAMAGSILLQSAPASAGNPDFPGGRGAAFRDFKQANDGLSGKQLNQLFKVHWADMRNSAQAVAQPVFEQNANNLSHGPNVVNTNLNNLQNLSNLPNQVGATKQELNQQFKLERQAQKLEHQALKQELREAKQNINTVQQISADRFIRGNGGFSLDLSSAVENITLGDKLFQNESSITISIGGESKTLSAGSKVTAAEYIAAKQVLATGGQKVGLDSNGRAVSGSIDLNELTPGDKTMKVRDFVVPENVSAAGDFSKNGDIRITGDLINSGTIQAFSSDNKITTATISADNITNNSNASISSELNQTARDLGGVVSNLGLNLRADDVLSNYGSITSSGDLTLSAGKTLNNSGSAIAQNNLNLQAPKIVNSGRVESIAANVNLDSSSLSALTVNNYGGSITALDGAINIRSSEYQERFDTLVSGGDLLSKELNVYTGGGTADVFVKELTGVVTTSGSAAHVSANTSELIIGEQCLVGDPTYYNTGNIILAGNVTVGEDLAIIAGGSIFTTASELSITARQTVGVNAGKGCNIFLIAGVNVQPGNGQTSVIPAQNGTPTNNATGSISFTGQSATGGSIDLTAVGGNLKIHADSIGVDQDGGNILMAAFGGSVLTSLASDIYTSGTGTGNNGNIRVFARNGIRLGTLRANGGLGTSPLKNSITVIASQPKNSSFDPVVFSTTGSMTSGNISFDSNFASGSKVEICNLMLNGDLVVRADGDVIMPVYVTSGTRSTYAVSYNGNLDFYGISSDKILAIAGKDINLNYGVSARTGMIFIAGHNIDGTSASSLKASAIGNTGNITLIAGATQTSPTQAPVQLKASAAGGSILLDGLDQIDNHSLGNNGNAGEINLLAYGGTIDAPVDFVNGGHGTGHSGKIFVNAQGIELGVINQTGAEFGSVSIVSSQPSSALSVTTNSGSGYVYGSVAPSSVNGNSSAPVKVDGIFGSQFVHISTGGDLQVGEITSNSFVNGVTVDITVNSSQTFLLGGGGLNGTGLITANAAFIGSGASISVTNLGTGGITVSNAPAMHVTDGNGTSLKLDAGSGTLDIATLGNSINADGIGTNRSAGTIDLRFGSLITASDVLSLSADATGSGNGGNIVFCDNVGTDNVILGNGPGKFEMHSSGPGSSIQITTGGAITVESSIGSRNLFLKSAFGGVLLEPTFDGDSLSISAAGPVSLLHNVSTIGNVNITASALSLNSNSISGGNIEINSPSGSGLILDGGTLGAILAATAPNGRIRVIASGGDLVLEGKTTFSTSAILTAGTNGSRIVATSGSVTTAMQTSYLLATGLTVDGSLVTLNDTWILTNGGSFVNGTDDISLSGNLSFSGLNLAIIAQGNIDLTGAYINLGSSTADGGNLTVIAGYSFSPISDGTVFDVGTFTNFQPNGHGVFSVLGNAVISTESSVGFGGSVTVVANGSVSLQSINTTGGARSGDVRVYATRGIHISGDIVTKGDSNGGNVNLELCEVAFPSSFQIMNGTANELPATGVSAVSYLRYASIDAGLADVTIRGSVFPLNSISGTGKITAEKLTVSVIGGESASFNTSVRQFSGIGRDAVISMTNDQNIAITEDTDLESFTLNNGANSVSSLKGKFQTLDITASDIFCQDAVVANNATLSATGLGSVSGSLDVFSLLRIEANSNIGSSDSSRFRTSAREISFSSGGSVYLSLTNDVAVRLGSSNAAVGIDILSDKRLVNADPSNTLLSAPRIQISTLAGDIGTESYPIRLTNGANQSSLTLRTGEGFTAYANYLGTDLLVLEDTVSSGSLILVSSSNQIKAHNLSYIGDINISANKIVNESAVVSTAGDINLRSLNGSGLTLVGMAGSIFAASNGTINVTAASGNLTLEGKTTFATTANLFAGGVGQGLVLSSDSETVANVSSFIYSGSVSGNGALTTISPQPNPTWTLFNYGTFTNTTYNPFVLSGTLKFGNLAILSNGNIDLTGATIDLSGPTGGNLTLIAGYNFSPSPTGQGMDFDTTFSNFTPNGYGSILGYANIVTSGTAGNSGNVLVVANHGAINLGTITTSSTAGAGGSVKLLADSSLTIGANGSFGISVGAINTTGVSSSGDVLLAACKIQLPTGNGFEVRNGQVVTGLSGIAPSTKFDYGSIDMDSIDVGSASVSLYGSLRLTQTSSAVLSASKLKVDLNSNSSVSNLNTNIQTLEVGGNSWLSVTNAENKDLSINPVYAPGVSLVVKGSGTSKISASDLTLNTLSLEASELLISGTVNATSVRLTSNGPITNANTGVLNTQGLFLQSLSSSVGTNQQRFIVGENVRYLSTSASGDVYIQSMRTTGFQIGSSSAGGDLDILGSGSTILDGHLKTTDGNINLAITSGTLDVRNASTIKAGGLTLGNGNILLRVSDTSKAAKKTAKISLVGAQLNTAATGNDGVITISVGAITAPVLGKAPKKNVQIINEGGTIFWGKKSAGFNPSTSVLHTKGANIVFNNAIGNRNIVMSGTTIFADPPVSEGTPITVITTPVSGGLASGSNFAVQATLNSSSHDIFGVALQSILSGSNSFSHLPRFELLNSNAADSGFGATSDNGVLLASSNLPLLTEANSLTRANEVRQLAFNSSFENDNSYIVGNAGFANEFVAGICTDEEIGMTGDGVVHRFQHSENVKLSDGSVLFAPLRDTKVETPKGTIRIAANSVALVSVSESGLSVFDLDDQHKGSISVESNGHNVVLSPGRHVLITPHLRAEFAQLNPIETIAHRGLSSSVKNGHRAHMSEFSVLSAIDSVKPLKALAASSHPNARKISGRMLKTTAILMQLGGAREQYQHYFRPHMTAMQK